MPSKGLGSLLLSGALIIHFAESLSTDVPFKQLKISFVTGNAMKVI